jgi:4-hydroxybenzoate polyprenyltransferase
MTIDDILDRDVDGLVARTKGRALSRGAISLERAWLFFTIQVALGIYLAINCLGETS